MEGFGHDIDAQEHGLMPNSKFISTVWRMDGRGGKGIRPSGKLLL